MIVDHMAKEAEATGRDLALQACGGFRKKHHNEAGTCHGGVVAGDGGLLGSIGLAAEALGDVVVIAPIAEQHHRNGAACGGGADGKVNQNRVRDAMAAHRLVEPPGGEPVVGTGAVKINTGVPVTQLVARPEAVAPKATNEPWHLQVDMYKIDTASFEFSTQKEWNI